MIHIVLLLTLLLQFNQTITQDVPSSLPITANFNGRSGGAVIAAQTFCTNITGLSGSTPLADLVAAGITCGRVFASEAQACPTAFNSCSWSNINSILTLLKNAGFTKVIVNVVGSGADLGTNPCNPPSSAANWATAVQSLVTNVNTNYATLTAEYEIENEPDLGTVGGTTGNWCPASGHTNLGDYLTLVHTAGPQLKTAFPSTKFCIGVLGGPNANGSTWINASTGIQSSSGWTSPDCISVHFYLGDQSTWALQFAQDMGASGTAHLISTMQSDAGAIPVQVTETNTSSAFANSCCRNTPTFAPMWVSNMYISYLNAATIPTSLAYYTDEGKPASPGPLTWFCIEGNLDANMDCDDSVYSRYPQWYAINLYQNSLNLNAGGNAATSVSPGVSSTGVSCAAFYTSAGGDVIACTNPTTTGYGQATFTFTNAGTLTGTATAYTLYNAAGSATTPTSNSTSIPCRLSGTTYTCTVGMPAQSTVAIKIT